MGLSRISCLRRKNPCVGLYFSKKPLCPLMTEISPAASARNLGTWLDMGTHITKTCSSAFYYLYNIRHIKKYLSRESTEKLVHAFISSRLDYCNSLLYGIPEYQTRKLQRVMNASARLIYRAHKFCHITPLLAELHWLPVRSRIHYKILLITFKILHGLSPKYLSDLISIQQPSSYNLRRNDNGRLLERPSEKTKKTMEDRACQVFLSYGISCQGPRAKQRTENLLRL